MEYQHDPPESSESQILKHTLLKLRMHEGLAPARLRRDRRNSAPLLNLASVPQLAAVDDTDAPEAALEIVRRCVRTFEEPTDRLVADAVLALRLFSDDYRASGIPERTIRDLESDGLGRRRTALLRDWQRLHSTFGSAAGSTPADRTLRETIELRVLSQLAGKLAGLGDRTSPVPPEPASRTSVPEPPGSKHFNQVLVIAVAAARLGLDVASVAALGDDQFTFALPTFRSPSKESSRARRVSGAAVAAPTPRTRPNPHPRGSKVGHRRHGPPRPPSYRSTVVRPRLVRPPAQAVANWRGGKPIDGLKPPRRAPPFTH